MPTLTAILLELHMHADALRIRAHSHMELSPGDSYVEQLMADNIEKLADRLETHLSRPATDKKKEAEAKS